MSKISKSVEVDVPVTTAYNQWTQFEEFPRFMEGVESVRQLDDKRLAWKAEIAGVGRDGRLIDRIVSLSSEDHPRLEVDAGHRRAAAGRDRVTGFASPA